MATSSCCTDREGLVPSQETVFPALVHHHRPFVTARTEVTPPFGIAALHRGTRSPSSLLSLRRLSSTARRFARDQILLRRTFRRPSHLPFIRGVLADFLVGSAANFNHPVGFGIAYVFPDHDS